MTTQSIISTPTPESMPSSLLPAYSPHKSPVSSHETSHAVTTTSPAISFARSGKVLSSFTTYTSSHRPGRPEGTTSQQTSNDDEQPNKLSTDTEIGIGIAIAIFVIAVLCTMGLIYRKRRMRKMQTATARVEALQSWNRNQDMNISLAK